MDSPNTVYLINKLNFKACFLRFRDEIFRFMINVFETFSGLLHVCKNRENRESSGNILNFQKIS